MASRTYYQILGVSRDATLEEITNAKNALAKVYHPDVNMQNGIDTTAQMQEILEAYRVLSNPEKRKNYDKELGGGTVRVFRTFDLGKEFEKDSGSSDVQDEHSFVTYWNAASKLHEVVKRSSWLLERESRRESIPIKIMKRIGKMPKTEQRLESQLNALSIQALQYITLLKSARIPMEYWTPEAMNWVLIRWGQNQSVDFLTIFAQYDAFVNQKKTTAEKAKMRSQTKQFHGKLKKLLTNAI